MFVTRLPLAIGNWQDYFLYKLHELYLALTAVACMVKPGSFVSTNLSLPPTNLSAASLQWLFCRCKLDWCWFSKTPGRKYSVITAAKCMDDARTADFDHCY